MDNNLNNNNLNLTEEQLELDNFEELCDELFNTIMDKAFFIISYCINHCEMRSLKNINNEINNICSDLKNYGSKFSRKEKAQIFCANEMLNIIEQLDTLDQYDFYKDLKKLKESKQYKISIKDEIFEKGSIKK